MLLTVNIGNINIDLAVFDGNEPIMFSQIATDQNKTSDQYCAEINNILKLYDVAKQHIDGAIVCSVVPKLSHVLEFALKTLFNCKVILLSSKVRTGINIKTDNPRLVGSDLVCGAVYAVHNNSYPCIIVNIETAITFTLIDKDATLCGYVIFPGPEISLEALKIRAAQLPYIGIETPASHVACKNTSDALKSGIVHGTASLIDGMVQKLANEVDGDVKIIASGMYTDVIIPFCQSEIQVEKNLLSYALNIIWLRNT